MFQVALTMHRCVLTYFCWLVVHVNENITVWQHETANWEIWSYRIYWPMKAHMIGLNHHLLA